MNILLTGVTGLRNRGVEALVSTALAEISNRRPDCRITVISSDPKYDQLKIGSRAHVIPDAVGFFRQSRARRSFKKAFFPKRWLGSVVPIGKAIASADLVIASGGDIFSSDYGTAFLKRQLAVIEEAQQAKRKTVFLGHSIGPFKAQQEIDLMGPVLRASSLITVRESFTQKYLVETFKLPQERVVLTSDVAFLLQPADSARIKALSSGLGLRPGVPYVALAPSEGITSFSDAQNRIAHDEAWIATVRHYLETTDCHVLLVPHVQDVNVVNDDTQIVFRIMEALGFPERVHAAIGPYSANDYKGLIGGAQMFAGERMHACIAALSQCVPSIVIGYSVKARGIMNDILGAENERLKLTIPVTDFVNSQNRSEMLTNIWQQRAAVRSLLEKSIPGIKKRATTNFELLPMQ